MVNECRPYRIALPFTGCPRAVFFGLRYFLSKYGFSVNLCYPLVFIGIFV